MSIIKLKDLISEDKTSGNGDFHVPNVPDEVYHIYQVIYNECRSKNKDIHSIAIVDPKNVEGHYEVSKTYPPGVSDKNGLKEKYGEMWEVSVETNPLSNYEILTFSSKLKLWFYRTIDIHGSSEFKPLAHQSEITSTIKSMVNNIRNPHSLSEGSYKWPAPSGTPDEVIAVVHDLILNLNKNYKDVFGHYDMPVNKIVRFISINKIPDTDDWTISSPQYPNGNKLLFSNAFKVWYKIYKDGRNEQLTDRGVKIDIEHWIDNWQSYSTGLTEK
jgi:hypothetical protein